MKANIIIVIAGIAVFLFFFFVRSDDDNLLICILFGFSTIGIGCVINGMFKGISLLVNNRRKNN